MKILIIYGTTHGCSEKCSVKLTNKLQALSPSPLDFNTVNAKGNADLDIAEYEVVIIGGAIRLGKMNKAILNFCKKKLADLILKKVGLFVCCMNKRDKAIEYMADSFPCEILETAMAKGYFGGELIFEKMAAIERSLLKSVMNYEKSVSLVDEEGIDAFAKKIYQEIGVSD